MNNLISMLRELDLEKNSKEDIRYVLNFIADELEKQEKISNLQKAYKDEINFVIETKANDEFDEYKDKVLELTDEDIEEIIDKMLDDNELNECLNNTIEYYVNRKAGE